VTVIAFDFEADGGGHGEGLFMADFVAKVGALDGCPSVIRLRATGFDLPALTRSTQLSLYAMH
jgi:hypothetical protein